MTTTTFARDAGWRMPREAANSETASPADLERRCARLHGELAELEGVVSAAVLTAAVFRMRDEAGLITALRQLAEAVAGLERRREAG